MPWEVFCKPLCTALKRSGGAKGGRPPYEAVMMFKILVLQALYSLSDDQAEFQVLDRLSFMRFLGWGSATRCPTPRRSGCSGSIWWGQHRNLSATAGQRAAGSVPCLVGPRPAVAASERPRQPARHHLGHLPHRRPKGSIRRWPNGRETRPGSGIGSPTASSR